MTGARLFDGLPVPVCLIDAEGRLVGWNPPALRLWGPVLPNLAGRPALKVLGIGPEQGSGDLWPLLARGRLRMPCRITLPGVRCEPAAAGGISARAGGGPVDDGRSRLPEPTGPIPPAPGPGEPAPAAPAAGLAAAGPGSDLRPADPILASILYVPLDGAPPLGALFILRSAESALLAEVPEWALRDPVTGLGNRHLWERETPRWAGRSGCVAFFDLDDLKEVNDLHGHVAGDRTLAAVGQALTAIAPPGALVVRYGGDEFVALLPADGEGCTEAWAQIAVRHVAASSAAADLPIVPRLSHGVAAFGPGGLAGAVQRADDVLYERKGVLFRAATGGRVILTREGRSALRGSGDDRRAQPARVPNQFGPEFAGYLRAAYARANEQARQFVRFAAPPAAGAVVEVAAGSGRLTFDGGLAERVGPDGQLFVTDPSGPTLTEARRRAAALGFDWVHFLRVPAEELPMASGSVDLVLGSSFLYLTEPVGALREMARILRPGGRVAVSTPLGQPWSAPMLRWLEPVSAVLARHGKPLGHILLGEDEILAAFAAAGLRVTRTERRGPDRTEYPDPETAIAGWRQVGLVPRLLKAVPESNHAAAQAAFEERLRASFGNAPEERVRSITWLHLVAVRA